jgi:hypothetical protein
MLPVLSREVVEGKQRVAILDQALDSLVVFDAPGMKASNAASASFLVSAILLMTCAICAKDPEEEFLCKARQWLLPAARQGLARLPRNGLRKWAPGSF